MQKILVTGAYGQMGKTFAALADQFSGFNFLFFDKDDLDICDKPALEAWFAENKVDYCINCAAYTAVDKAESDRKQAWAVNVTGAGNLAKVCNPLGIPLIHFSTDYVHHSLQNTPYKETDITDPKGVYASTKLEGEEHLLSAYPDAMIIRTSWVYSNYGHNFVKTMLRLGKERDQLTVVCDQIGTPTLSDDLALSIMHLLEGVSQGTIDRNLLSGIYNYSNEGVCSWYDFALAIFEMAQIDCAVKPILTKDFPTAASRPPYSVLDKSKFKETFNTDIPYWREALKRMLEKEDY
jgi:dTDP-4-dehydrorhamnose reductase